jgi:allantoinase
VVNRDLPADRIANLLSTAPAKRFRLPRKETIDVNFDADFAVVELGTPTTLTADQLRYRHRHSPFIGTEFAVAVRRTIVRGTAVALDGATLRTSGGELFTPIGYEAG